MAKSMKKFKFVFDSWTEFVDHAEKAPSQLSRRESRNTAWGGNDLRFEEAIKLARNGWTDTTGSVTKISGDIFNKMGGMVKRPEILYDVEGGEVDIAQYVQGEPECWIRFQHLPVPTPGNMLKMVFNYSASGGLGAAAYTAKGAAIVALIELLEFAGKQVELWCVDTSAYNASTGSRWNTRRELQYENWVKVKDHNQPIDMGRLMYALAHQTMLRRLGFAIQETAPTDYLQNWGDSTLARINYGAPAAIEEADWGDIYVDSTSIADAYINWNDTKAVVGWVLGKLKAQGLELNEAA